MTEEVSKEHLLNCDVGHTGMSLAASVMPGDHGGLGNTRVPRAEGRDLPQGDILEVGPCRGRHQLVGG